MRGFSVGSMALDGLSFRDYNVDLDDIDHVEFLTGLSGYLYGFEDPGGMVNYVLKKPTATPLANLTFSSFGGKNGAFHGDFGGPIGKSGKFGYRLNVMGEDGDTPVENQTEMHGLATAVLDWHVTNKALIELNGSWSRRDDEGSLPFWIVTGAYPAAPDPKKLWGEKWGNSIYYRVREGAKFTWDLNSIFSVRAAFNYTEGSGKSISVNNKYTAGNSTYSQSAIMWAASRLVTETGGIYLDARFKTGALRHTVTTGFADYNYISYMPTDDSYFTSTVSGFSFTTPTYIDKPSHTFTKGPKHEYFDQGHRAAFVNDRIEWRRWTAILGVNHATAIDTDHDTASPYEQTDSYSKATFAPTASLIYKPIDRVSTYFTYMQGLEPGEVVPSWYTNANQVFAPTIDRQYELGAKAIVGHALLTAALFDIDKVNAVTLADGSYAQKGMDTHRGVEISASGKVWNDLVLYGGLTYMSPVVTKDPSLNGKRPTDASRELAKVFADYPIHAVRGLAVNGGVYRTGSFYADSDNTVKLPGYTTEDLGVHYELQRKRPLIFRFNVTNVTNKAYWMSSRFTGSPREFNFGVEYKLF
jgi:iron complex outermembrane recepter protein